MVVAILIVSLFAATRRPRAGIVLLAGFAIALFIAWTVREAIFEPFGGYPSGHALRATYVAVALWAVTTSRLVRFAACIFVAIICLAAVYTGNHYSEEIIGGLLLGYAIATGGEGLRVRLPKERERSETPAPRTPTERDELAYFVAIVRGTTTPSGLSSLENNLIVTEILDAARESARTGKAIGLAR
jgi:hypothetical protein